MTENSANDHSKLEFPMSVWKRNSMYLGARSVENGQKSVATREIIDNAVHEVIRGFATKVHVTFGKDGSVTVQDDGRGLPTDENKKLKVNGIILTMATLHAGSNFSSEVQAGKAGAGLNGVGGASCNAMSKRFEAHVYKGGKHHYLEFQDGFAGFFDGEDPDSKFSATTKIKEVKDTRSAAEKKEFKKGTKIKFWFNDARFPTGELIAIDDLVDRLKYTAYIVPGINLRIVDENRTYEDGSAYSWDFYSEHGIQEMIEAIATDETLPSTDSKGDLFTEKGIYKFSGAANYNELTTDESDGLTKEFKRTVTYEVAFRYGTGYEKNLVSFVNTIHTHLGGIHEKALEKALLKGFGDRIGSVRGLLTAKDEPPIIDDFFEGLTAVISVNIPEPQFVGQQKDKVSGPEVQKALTKALTEDLTKFANNAANQKFLKPMFEKVVQASKNRQAAATAKLAKRKTNQMSSAAMPAKLSDCDITGTDESELIICEGDSAAGTVKKARDATYQAVIPIRGKIMNGFKASNTEILKNTEAMDIAKAMGAGFGKDFDIDKIRYGKILFAADADHDGLHICNLLFTVFWRLFKPMLEEGRVYQTVPPLFEVTVGSGKKKEVVYVVDNLELSQVTKKFDKAGKKYTIERNKGLGEMEPRAFYDTVLDPENRTLRKITLEEAEAVRESLLLTMGENSESRKEFIGDNFQTAIDSGLVEQ